MFSIHAYFHRVWRHIRVTFSSKISNCFSTEPRRRCECSSTTRIFHLPGGFTERIASRNSVTKIAGQCRECMCYTGDRRRSEPSRSAGACRERDALALTVVISDDIALGWQAAGQTN